MTVSELARKRWLRIVFGLIVAGGLLAGLTPLSLKYYLIYWLKQNGAESASIESLSINPFAGKITLAGLDVKGGERSILHHSKLVIDLDFTSLLDRDIRVETAEYRDLFLEIEQGADGSWRYGSYTMSGEPQVQKLDPPKATGPDWGFRADQVVVANCRIQLKTPKLAIVLAIDQAELNRFTTRKDQQAGTLLLKGTLNDSPLVIDLATLRINPGVTVDGTVGLTGFKLDAMARLLASSLPELQGIFGLQGKVLLVMSETGDMRFDYDGTLGLDSSVVGNPVFHFSGKANQWTGKILYDAPQGKPGKIATDGKLAFKDATVKLPNAKLDLTAGEIAVEGRTALELGTDVQTSHDGKLMITAARLSLPNLKFQQQSTSWQGQVRYGAGSPDTITSKGTLDLAATKLDLAGKDFPMRLAARDIRWDGAANVGLAASADTTVELAGKLITAGIDTELPAASTHLAYEQLKLSTAAKLTLAETFKLQAKSDGELRALQLRQNADQANSLEVELAGLSVSGLVNQGTTGVTLAGLQTSGLKTGTAGNLPLQTSLQTLDLTDFATSDLTNFTIGAIDLKAFTAVSTASGETLAGVESLALNSIATSTSGTFSAASVKATGLSMLKSSEDSGRPFLALADITTDSLQWSPQQGLQSGNLAIQGLHLQAVKAKDGAMVFSRRLAAMQPESASGAGRPDSSGKDSPTPAEPGSQEPSTPVKIAAITIGKDSSLVFRDETLAEPFTAYLVLGSLSLTDIDSTKPDQAANLLLDGKLENKAPLKLTGTIKPFQLQPEFNLELVVKNYPLTSLSPYTVQAVGTGLAGGNLKLQSKAALTGDAIDMKNHLVLEKLTTKTIAPELAAKLNNQLPVPLDAALVMMRDDDGNITLDIPVKGPLDNLNVGIASIVVTALNKSIVSAASSYFTYALGPYAALAYVGMKVGEKMLQVDLPPVVFSPQASTLSDEHRDYLGRIAKILSDNPDQDLRLTPHVSTSEISAQNEQGAAKPKPADPTPEEKQRLEELAEQRLSVISSYLREEHGIDKLRLLASDMVVDREAEAKPRVTLEVK